MPKKGVIRNRIDLDKAMRLYNKGEPDNHIAKVCGVTRGAVLDWRRRMGLEKNPDQKKYTLSPLELDAIAARAAGMTYGQYIAAGRPGRV